MRTYIIFAPEGIFAVTGARVDGLSSTLLSKRHGSHALEVVAFEAGLTLGVGSGGETRLAFLPQTHAAAPLAQRPLLTRAVPVTRYFLQRWGRLTLSIYS